MWSVAKIKKEELYGEGKNMKAYLKFMLSLNILKHFAKGQTVWSDIRISRKIFKRFLFKDHSHHQS